MKERILFLILFINIFFSIILFDPKQDTGGDNAIYLSLAKSIISLKGYREIYKPDEPLHTQYPPGYPLILSILLLFTDIRNPIPFKVLNLLFGIFSIIIFYYLFKRMIKGFLLYAFIFLIAINPTFIEYSNKILSEIPFIFFSFLSFYIFEKYKKTNDIKMLFFLPIFSAFPYYIRTMGIVLVFSFVFFFIISKNYKGLFIYSLIVSIIILPWIIRGRMIGGQFGYKWQLFAKNAYDYKSGLITFKDFFIRIIENIKIYLFYINPVFFFPILLNVKSKILFVILGLVLLILIFLGVIINFKKRYFIYSIYFILFFSLCLIWPSYWSSERFLLPLLPLLIYFFVSALEWIKNKFRIKEDFYYITFFVLFLSVLIHLIPLSLQNLNMLSEYIKGNKYSGYSLDYIRFYEAADFARNNTPKDAKFLVRKPELFYIASDRKSFCYPFTYEEKEVLNAIDNADYIVVDAFFWTGTTRRYLIPVIMKELDNYIIFYKTHYPETYILIKK